MTLKLNNCAFLPASPGTGSFVYASTLPKFLSPTAAEAVDGGEYAQRADNGAEWEISIGIYDEGTGAITRATVVESSNGGALVDFSAPPKVRMGIPLAADYTSADYTQGEITFGPEMVEMTSNNWQTNVGDLPSSNWSLDGDKLVHTPGSYEGVVYNVLVPESGYYEVTQNVLQSGGLDGGVSLVFGAIRYQFGADDTFIVACQAGNQLFYIDPQGNADFECIVEFGMRKVDHGDKVILRNRDGTPALVFRAGDTGSVIPAVIECIDGGFTFERSPLGNGSFGIRDAYTGMTATLETDHLNDGDQQFSFPSTGGVILAFAGQLNPNGTLGTDEESTVRLRSPGEMPYETLVLDGDSPGGEVDVTLSRTYITTAGPEGDHPFQMSLTDYGLTGHEVTIIYNGQTSPGDVPALDPTNFVDVDGVQAVSIRFALGDIMLVKLEPWRDNNNGKWRIIGVSDGVVTI